MRLLMQTFKDFTLLSLFLIFSMTGCIAGSRTQPSPIDVETATSEVVIALSTPKAVYTAEDTIPLELSIQNGKFDLLVPFVHVTTPGGICAIKGDRCHG